MQNGPTDVVAMCSKVRDGDRYFEDRHQAAVDLVEKCELRSLRDLIEVVFGPDPCPSVDEFEICASAWSAAEEIRALA